MPQFDITTLFQFIYNILTSGFSHSVNASQSLTKIIFWYKVGAYIFIIAGSCFAVVILTKLLKIRSEQTSDLKLAFMNVSPEATEMINPRWQAIADKLESDNQADWQWAIIEADKILDEMVERMGYQGANLGERLKTIEKSDFTSLNEAWEAHKVRNQIAHEPGFVLDKRKASITIGQFEKVFKEFHYI